jgi:mannose-1-phosphate guanylyltransferase
MIAILFSGGVGQRLWPLSRRNTPKQFVPLVGPKSSFELSVERLKELVPSDGMFVATNRLFGEMLQKQAPEIPPGNFILEPVRRDVAAAVALAFFSLQKDGRSGPVLFQWTDNYVKNEPRLLSAIRTAETLLAANPSRVIFIGETPRFANENLGWIELGDELGRIDDTPYFSFRSWHYRPPKNVAAEMLASGRYIWNSGYFMSSIEFMTSAFRSLAPELAAPIEEIVSYRGTVQESEKLEQIYRTVPALHFDEAILERLSLTEALLLQVDLGWSDPGSLYSLKEALQDSQDDNVSRGKVVTVATKDSLIYNDSPGKLVAVMGLEGIMVVDTPDVTLVIHKDSVRHLGKLLDELAAKGWDQLL